MQLFQPSNNNNNNNENRDLFSNHPGHQVMAEPACSSIFEAPSESKPFPEQTISRQAVLVFSLTSPGLFDVKGICVLAEIVLTSSTHPPHFLF